MASQDHHRDGQAFSPRELRALEPRCVVTRIRFRQRRDYLIAISRFNQLRLLPDHDTAVVAPSVLALARHRRRREIVITSVWPSEYELLTFTSHPLHVEVSRWTGSVDASVWSGLFVLDGTSSLSQDKELPVRRWRPAIADWSRLRSAHRRPATERAKPTPSRNQKG